MSGLRAALRDEAGLYVALACWILRRPDVPAGARAWGYSKLASPMMWLWIFASALEVPLFGLVIPWPWLRLVFLVLGVWGFLWMLGLLATWKVYPHLTDGDAVRVRSGVRADVRVPWGAIDAVRHVDDDLSAGMRGCKSLDTDAGTELHVGSNKRANVRLELAGPTAVRTRDGDQLVTAVVFHADEPADLIRTVDSALAARRHNASEAHPST